MIVLLFLALFSTALAAPRLRPAFITGDGHSGVESRIINGVDVSPVGKYPWQGSLVRKRISGRFTHSCGCIYLGNRRVMTAAHCAGDAASNMRIRLGVHDRSDDTVGQPETFEIASIALHPGWIAGGDAVFIDDIAIIGLASTPSSDNSFIKSVNLPALGAVHVDQDCVITGWGRTTLSPQDPIPEVLQEAPTNVLTNAACRVRLGSDGSIIAATHICIYTGDNGPCNGDSGGPLICRSDSDSDWVVAGITSFGISACSTDYPTVYTRVSKYLSFINGP